MPGAWRTVGANSYGSVSLFSLVGWWVGGWRMLWGLTTDVQMPGGDPDMAGQHLGRYLGSRGLRLLVGNAMHSTLSVVNSREAFLFLFRSFSFRFLSREAKS
ncbi:uncharacterized protein K452DRAFT_111854 [Aplosporella prunicola CBS 121167]|uniref:Uncharacterized protein n=1 Tax=Aplosporella prunicola CBS 121167 TaxID=1176127 RepID=A0A6A6B1U8_9PEZI|nr:uncharacterized protein K452DRAFT_111854 [Aplosporella prunicola CBS 121167]KAF2137343.1 hypothetical protein K452DRAFT_111854 [Aplosporella prunicola CBS 121167]